MTGFTAIFLAVCLAAVTGCDRDPPETSDVPVAPPVVLSPVERAVRLSMTLRGIHPSEAELDRVLADPAAVDGLVDDWLASPQFAEVVRDLHAEILLVRADGANRLEFPPVGLMEGYAEGEIDVSASEAPLRFVEEIVTSGRPYTEILTADYTVADAVVARIYGLDFDPDGPTWQHTTWSDGRPHAGLLSDSAIWRRQVSNGYNYHRGRADFLADAFLCSAFSQRSIPLEGGVVTSSDAGVADAIANNTSCRGCHDELDPLAAYLWGFRRDLDRNNIALAHSRGCAPGTDDADLCYPLRFYDPAREAEWQEHALPAPGYFGQAVDGLPGLGRAIAEDPRFAPCVARRFEAWLTETEVADIPADRAAELGQVLVDAGYDAKALIRAIVTSDRFGYASPGGLTIGEAAPVQVARLETWARTVEDLTGFRWWVSTDAGYGCPDGWCWGTVDLSTTDKFGYRYLVGGISGVQIVQPTYVVGPVKSLALAAIAREAAGYVVDHDFAAPASERRLLGGIEPTVVDEPAVRAQLAALQLRILAEPVDPADPALDAAYAVWQAGAADGDPSDGWRLVITAMLQDPAMVLY
ncbi:MAG: DUF1592 domain-containing protein [Myxococcota bacterium]